MHWLNTVIGAKIVSPLTHWTLFPLSERKMHSWCSAWLQCLAAKSLCCGWSYCRDLVFQQKESEMVSLRGSCCKLSCLRRAGSLRAVSPVTANSSSSCFFTESTIVLLVCKAALTSLSLFQEVSLLSVEPVWGWCLIASCVFWIVLFACVLMQEDVNQKTHGNASQYIAHIAQSACIIYV